MVITKKLCLQIFAASMQVISAMTGNPPLGSFILPEPVENGCFDQFPLMSTNPVHSIFIYSLYQLRNKPGWHRKLQALIRGFLLYLKIFRYPNQNHFNLRLRCHQFYSYPYLISFLICYVFSLFSLEAYQARNYWYFPHGHHEEPHLEAESYF